MSLANPTDLIAAPELATLALLDEAIQQTIYVLFAVHPELVSGGTLQHRHHLNVEAWLADALYNQANALQHAIQRYRESVARAAALRHSDDEDL